MNISPVTYIAHPVTGEFVGTGFPDPDPLDAGNWLVPAHAFLDAPPVAGERQAIVRLDSSWRLLPDYRGYVYYTADGVKHEISELGVEPQEGAIEQPPPPSKEELAELARAEWKRQRADKVGAIKVTTVAGHTFDGDEQSQGRMARAILGLQAVPGGTVTWVLADNSVQEVGAAELTEALALAGAEQARLWVAA